MLGMFNTLMMYLGVITERSKYAGMRDFLIQSKELSRGSVDRALVKCLTLVLAISYFMKPCTDF